MCRTWERNVFTVAAPGEEDAPARLRHAEVCRVKQAIHDVIIQLLQFLDDEFKCRPELLLFRKSRKARTSLIESAVLYGSGEYSFHILHNEKPWPNVSDNSTEFPK